MKNTKNIQKTIGLLSDDLAETLQALSSNVPHKSTTWRLFRAKGLPDKRYVLDDLGELMSDIRAGRVAIGVMRYTRGSLDDARKNPDVAKYLEDTTGFNMCEFVYACCYDKTFLELWLDEIISIILAPLTNAEPGVRAALKRILYRVHDAINSGNAPNQKVH